MENLILQEIKRDKGGRIIWSKDQIDYIISNYNEYHSTPAIANFFKVNRETIRTVLRKQGIKILSLHELQLIKKPRNSNYFENIDTPAKAYWLGFLYADGNISQNIINITLNIKDKNHLIKFKNAIGAINSEIHESKVNNYGKEYEIARFWIGDKKMAQDLRDKGCVPNKSLILTFPYEYLSEDLYSHFIRGYIDGDGCLSCSPSYKGEYNAFSLSIIGTQDFLNAVKKILGKETLNLRPKGKNFDFVIGGNNQLKSILSYIYKDSYDEIELTRKREKYNEYLEMRKNKYGD